MVKSNGSSVLGLWVLAFSLSLSVYAGSVTEVLDGGRRLRINIGGAKWKSGQVVCVMRDANKVACGLLADIKDQSGIVSLDFRNQMPVVGDLILSATEAKNMEKARVVASSLPKVDGALVEGDNIHFVSGGRNAWFIGATSRYDLEQFGLGATLETFVAPRVAYSLEFTRYDVTDKQPLYSGYTLMLRRTFRATRQLMGIFGGLGGGAYFFELGAAKQLRTVAAFEGYAGWAIRLNSWLSATASVGILYLTHPQSIGSSIGPYRRWRPNFSLSIGTTF